MKKVVLAGKTKEQLTELLSEQKAGLTKAQMVFGPKPSQSKTRKEIARIMTELSVLAKQSH